MIRRHFTCRGHERARRAIIVTTPQDVSLKIARRGLRMFETVHVPILGIVENMSTFTCPHCGKDTDVFRRGGGERMSLELGVPFLGSIPLEPDVVTCGDEGRPIVIDKPNSVVANAYLAIATELAERLERLPDRRSSHSRGRGTRTRERPHGWRAPSVQRALERPPSVSVGATRARCLCSGRTATRTTSTFGTFASRVDARSASKR